MVELKIKLNGKYPYDCKEYKTEEITPDIDYIIIETNQLDDEVKRAELIEEIKKKFIGKHVWALYGSNDSKDTWICLQTASLKTNDITVEIIEDIKAMLERTPEGRVWRSKFHEAVFQPDYSYYDLRHQRYNLIKRSFEYLMFVHVTDKILENYRIDGINESNRYKWTEVVYACERKPLFWCAFNEENEMVRVFLQESGKE